MTAPSPDPRPAPSVQEALAAAKAGDTENVERFFTEAYDQLRRYANALLQSESASHTLQPTALVHEAWQRAASSPPPGLGSADPRHAIRSVAKIMRRILIDHARAKHAAKRGGRARPIELQDDVPANRMAPESLRDLDPALDWLAAHHARKHEVVMLHLYGGLTFEQVAAVIEVDRRTAVRDWEAARELLAARLKDPAAGWARRRRPAGADVRRTSANR